MLTRILSRVVRSRRPAPTVRRSPLGLEALETREVPAIVYGLTAANTIVRFDSDTPGLVGTTVALTGLGAGQQVVGIDFRPRTGQLYASAVTDASANSAVFTYRVNPLTGAATLIGSTAVVTGAGDQPTGYDFNPTVDRIRYVNTSDLNLRLNPNNGAIAGTDTALTPAATTDVIAEAYDRNFDRQNNAGDTNTLGTTLYVINRANSQLGIQGGLNGTPSPNGGVVTNIGALGVTLDATADAGFDIAAGAGGGLGTGLAALTVAGVTGLYSINLSTGAATLIGNIGNGSTQLTGMAVVPDSILVVGSGLGANGDVRILDAATGAIRAGIIPFAGYQGGVRVATGDVTRDGVPDVIVSANAPQGHVKVFDGVTGAQLTNNAVGSFFAFQGFEGTVNVGAGDVNRDGFADVLVVANGVNGHVKAFSGADGSEIASFLAFDGYTGNSTISAADFNNDGIDEIVVGAGLNGHVKVFNANGTLFSSSALPGFVPSFISFTTPPRDGTVAAGDVNGDGIPDIVVSSGAGTRGQIRVFNGADNTVLSDFFAFGVGINVGASVALSDANGDGRYDISVTSGAGRQADVLTFDAVTGLTLGVSFAAFSGFQGGATIGGTRF